MVSILQTARTCLSFPTLRDVCFSKRYCLSEDLFNKLTFSGKYINSRTSSILTNSLNRQHYYNYLCRECFSTSPRRSIPPLIWLLVKPLAKLSAALTGRGIRRWWQTLPKHKKRYFMERMKQNWPVFALSSGGLVFAGLVYYELHIQETPVTGRKRFIAVTPEQLKTIAAAEAQTHRDKYQGSLVPKNKPVWKRVECVANRIIESNPVIKKMDVKKWQLTVIDDKTINAFVVCNGHIFVFVGLVDFVDNDDQLACVLGHEMAHALLSHSAELISYAQLMDFIVIAFMAAIWMIVPTDGVALLTQWFNNKVLELILHLPYSRKLEKEADKVGLALAARACYDVRAGSVFWKKMELHEKYLMNESVPEWLSTHPASENRVKFLDYLIPQALEIREHCRCVQLPAQDPRDQYRYLEQDLSNTTTARRAGQNLQKVPVITIRGS